MVRQGFGGHTAAATTISAILAFDKTFVMCSIKRKGMQSTKARRKEAAIVTYGQKAFGVHSFLSHHFASSAAT